MISYQKENADIIKDFVALGFIVEIDDMFAKNMKGYKVEELIDEFRGKLLIQENTNYFQHLGKKLKKCYKKIRKNQDSDEEEEEESDNSNDA